MKEDYKELSLEAKPEIICVVDEATQYGIERGYYPDIAKTKYLEFLNPTEENKIKDVKYLGGFKIGESYAYCPAYRTYIPFSNKYSDIYNRKRVEACYEVIRMMGAKDFKYTLASFEQKNLKWQVEGNLKTPVYDIEAEVSEDTKQKFQNIMIKSRTKEKHTSSIEDIERYMLINGLMDDDDVRGLFNELKEEGKLTGEYKLTFKSMFNQESLFKTAAKISKSKIFSVGANLNIDVNTLYEIEYNLDVKF